MKFVLRSFLRFLLRVHHNADSTKGNWRLLRRFFRALDDFRKALEKSAHRRFELVAERHKPRNVKLAGNQIACHMLALGLRHRAIEGEPFVCAVR